MIIPFEGCVHGTTGLVSVLRTIGLAQKSDFLHHYPMLLLINCIFSCLTTLWFRMKYIQEPKNQCQDYC